MVIAHLIYRLELGGAEIHLRTLTHQQCQRGDQVYLIVLGYMEPKFRETFNADVRFVDLSNLHLLTKLWNVSNVCRINRIQILHSHLPLAEIFSSLAFLPSITKRVTTRHTPGNLSHRFKHNFLLPLSKFVLCRADIIVAISNSVASSLQRIEGVQRKRIEIVHYGFDYPLSPNFRKAIPDRDNSNFVFLCVARLEQQKRVWDLLQAFANIREEMPNANLRVAGSGRQFYAMQKWICDNRLQEKIHLLGKVENIESEYTRANVFVLPTEYEGFGNVYIEAVAHSLPIISTKNETVFEILSEHEFYGYPIGNVEQLSEILKMAYVECRTGGVGRSYSAESILSRFSATHMASELAKVYLKL